VDSQGLALPGVTVPVSSPNLQGRRTVVSSQNGDFIVAQLPAGAYTITFELTGFENVVKSATLAPTVRLAVDAMLGVARMSDTVNVVGSPANLLTGTAQVATDFSEDLMATLPTNRTLDAALLLAPSVHPTGPAGAYSIAGSTSFETLYMVNGVNVTENLRGQAMPLFIEDAIQETTIATSGISAEFGRFGGGVVNVITKSGGNLFGGSFRDTLYNDGWRTLTPFTGDTKIDKVVPAYEYTLGGPVMKDHLWFFTAGRLLDQQSARQTVVTRIPYVYEDNEKRFEGKVTYSPNSNHSFQGNFVGISDSQTNDSFNPAAVMDLASLDNRKLPQSVYSLNYTGVLSPTLFIEARASARYASVSGSGSPFTDQIRGTLLIDRVRGGTRYWSPTFCGACDDEKRDNSDVFAKGTYFLSTAGSGSHNMVFGVDAFNDKRFANNHQSGSDYRIIGTTSIIQGSNIYPQWIGDGSTLIQYSPILQGSQGTNFRTYSLFYNDGWRVNSRLTANLGLRWDRNHGNDQAGNLVANDSAWSPRAGIVWDPTGGGTWSVTASFAKYVAALTNSIADAGSIGGQAAGFQWVYGGPSINADPNGPLVTSDAAIQQVFAWFNANGGQHLPLVGVNIPGVAMKIVGSLDSPNVLEYAAGVNRQLGNRGALRVDGVYRNYRDFYVLATDTATGQVSNDFGQTFDFTKITNSNDLTRRYAGIATSFTYRLGDRLDLGGNYTLSHAWGNIEGESANAGPLPSSAFQYPEYKDATWNNPVGDLSIDQRHRGRLWASYRTPWIEGLTLSALEDLASGTPYGAMGQIDARPYVVNPGYATPQGGASETYYFTARDAFRTDGTRRTDFAANYNFAVKTPSRKIDLFVQGQVINLFNQFQLCGCGGSVFVNGGPFVQTRIDQSVLSNSTTPSKYARFDPFTTSPVEGTNWGYGSNFGKPLNRFAYTTPMTLRVSFGVRF